mmetsp:Transcript_13392/g.32257  ORF Transcript_13392/g.32257 Transcript_13392/m.32257 type:complete len:243 (-) Transcript_13392:547-1275(-)
MQVSIVRQEGLGETNLVVVFGLLLFLQSGRFFIGFRRMDLTPDNVTGIGNHALDVICGEFRLVIVNNDLATFAAAAPRSDLGRTLLAISVSNSRGFFQPRNGRQIVGIALAERKVQERIIITTSTRCIGRSHHNVVIVVVTKGNITKIGGFVVTLFSCGLWLLFLVAWKQGGIPAGLICTQKGLIIGRTNHFDFRDQRAIMFIIIIILIVGIKWNPMFFFWWLIIASLWRLFLALLRRVLLI